MTATTPGTASNSESRKRMAEAVSLSKGHSDTTLVEEFAVTVACLLAGRMDGQQAIASLAAQAARLIEQARAEGAAEVVARVEALFAGGPDTACRTTWRPAFGGQFEECVEVPMYDLRAALRGPR